MLDNEQVIHMSFKKYEKVRSGHDLDLLIILS